MRKSVFGMLHYLTLFYSDRQTVKCRNIFYTIIKHNCFRLIGKIVIEKFYDIVPRYLQYHNRQCQVTRNQCCGNRIRFLDLDWKIARIPGIYRARGRPKLFMLQRLHRTYLGSVYSSHPCVVIRLTPSLQTISLHGGSVWCCTIPFTVPCGNYSHNKSAVIVNNKILFVNWIDQGRNRCFALSR